MPSPTVKIVECPRDAMQGIKTFIPTELKIRYMQFLLSVGFHTLDFGSFVSPKAIPQMRDTAKVIEALDMSPAGTKLLAIIANIRGARDALQYEKITYLGYPFSISEIFQMRNTGKTIAESVNILDNILEMADKSNKEVVTYLSMGFGNPYGEPWNEEIVGQWTERLSAMGVRILSLSDTVGTATPEMIGKLFSYLIPRYPHIEFGAHLHTHPRHWKAKVEKAFEAGCMRFDGAVKGYGGCPMAKDEMTGNMPTENLLSFFQSKRIPTGIDPMRFESAYNMAVEVFSHI